MLYPLSESETRLTVWRKMIWQKVYVGKRHGSDKTKEPTHARTHHTHTYVRANERRKVKGTNLTRCLTLTISTEIPPTRRPVENHASKPYFVPCQYLKQTLAEWRFDAEPQRSVRGVDSNNVL